MEAIKTDGWEPIIDSEPSEQFVCKYGGNFAQSLLINRSQIETFLSIASLDGSLILEESRVKKPVAMPDGINPDGSVTGRSSLRWGQKLETEDKKRNPYFQVEPNEVGWTVSVNGDLIQGDLLKSGLNAREMAEPFAKKFEYYTRVGLREALLKDKFTTAKDPMIMGKYAPSFLTAFAYLNSIINPGLETAFWTFIYAGSNLMINSMFHTPNTILDSFYNPSRKTLKILPERMDTALEVDRALFAYIYLDYQKYLGDRLVKVAESPEVST